MKPSPRLQGIHRKGVVIYESVSVHEDFQTQPWGRKRKDSSAEASQFFPNHCSRLGRERTVSPAHRCGPQGKNHRAESVNALRPVHSPATGEAGGKVPARGQGISELSGLRFGNSSYLFLFVVIQVIFPPPSRKPDSQQLLLLLGPPAQFQGTGLAEVVRSKRKTQTQPALASVDADTFIDPRRTCPAPSAVLRRPPERESLDLALDLGCPPPGASSSRVWRGWARCSLKRTRGASLGRGRAGGDLEARAGGPARRGRDGLGIPVVILLAVNAAVLGEAGELGLERQLTFTALQAPQVPLLVHGQQVVPVGDLAPAASAQGGLLRAQRGHALQGSARAVRSARGRPTRVPGAEPAPGLPDSRTP